LEHPGEPVAVAHDNPEKDVMTGQEANDLALFQVRLESIQHHEEMGHQ
jgi:hypothetical protein